MKKIILVVLTIFVSSINYAQNCDCSSNLKWLIETFEKNDAGFQYIIDKKGENAYLAHNKIFKEKALKIEEQNKCLSLLNDWTEFFRKDHLQVVLNNTKDNSTNNKELYEKEIRKLYDKSLKFVINEEDFETYVSKIKDKNSFEGIWEIGPYTIGIIKDVKNINREYVGFIIKSQNPYWKKNQIIIEILKDGNEKYKMKIYKRNRSVKEIENFEVAGYNYLLVNNSIFLKRIKPEFKTDPNTKLFIKSMLANKPFIEKVSENTILLRIPSFRRSMKKDIDSLLENNNELIAKTENLIIDLRNNGGGSDASYQKIIPYLYTNPIRDIGLQFLSTELNNNRMVDFMNDENWSEEDKEWAKNSLEKLNKHIGEFVNLKNNIVSIDTLDKVLPYPKNVAVLINHNCGSSTEQFLLEAKQSKKVKLFGTTTLGSLDISNMYSVNSPSREFTLHYGLSKSYRIPGMTIDGKGIQPDYYYDKTIKPYEWIKMTEEILNYK